jgi:prolyl oligopeptidase
MSTSSNRLLAPMSALLLAACPDKAPPTPTAAEPSAMAYPTAPRGTVVDDYHGTAVPDPFRPLEDPDSAETRAWVDAEIALTRTYLDGIPARGAIENRLRAIWNYERFSSPTKVNGRYFWSRNDGLQAQAVVYTADKLDGESKVLLDPNSLSSDGTISLGGMSVNRAGTKMAWATSDGGSDWRTWRIRDIATGTDLPESIAWSKFSGASWSADDAGFYYSRYDEPKNPLEQVNDNQQVWFHQLGTPQSADLKVFADPDHPQRGFSVMVSEDGKHELLYVWEGTENKNRIWHRHTTKNRQAPFKPVLDQFDAYYNFVGNEGDVLWFVTDKDAPRGRLIAVDLKKPDPAHWSVLIPERAETLEGVSAVGGRLVANYLRDAHSVVTIHDTKGKLIQELNLPGIGTAGGFSGEWDDTESFYSYSSYATPPRLYRLDLTSLASTLWKEAKVDFNPDAFEVNQVFYPSKDGTKVPMFIAHKKGLVLNGENPVILYGYGGFNISLTPGFSPSRVAWMEMGGVYAVANLRGGGEYGKDWHDGGRLLNKQNVFDDFIAAAEYLHANGYSKPAKTAIQGGSNGGLLVGAAMTQRPDLFGAALPAVGVMDMLRYHLFTIGWAWASDYGRSDDPQYFPLLHRYSPLHALKDGVRYPSTLVVTADHDDRVVPAHSYKFAARLQEAHKGENPVLIRIETRAGHGAGKSTDQLIEENADILAFLKKELAIP